MSHQTNATNILLYTLYNLSAEFPFPILRTETGIIEVNWESFLSLLEELTDEEKIGTLEWEYYLYHYQRLIELLQSLGIISREESKCYKVVATGDNSEIVLEILDPDYYKGLANSDSEEGASTSSWGLVRKLDIDEFRVAFRTLMNLPNGLQWTIDPPTEIVLKEERLLQEVMRASRIAKETDALFKKKAGEIIGYRNGRVNIKSISALFRLHCEAKKEGAPAIMLEVLARVWAELQKIDLITVRSEEGYLVALNRKQNVNPSIYDDCFRFRFMKDARRWAVLLARLNPRLEKLEIAREITTPEI